MPELTLDDLSALFAWIVDAQGFLPLSEGAKSAVDKLIEQQEQLKEQKADFQQFLKQREPPAWVEQMDIVNNGFQARFNFVMGQPQNEQAPEPLALPE
jgi:hypothetical protein